jgi:hypothetical protein
MEREVIIKKTVHNIEMLPTRRIREVNDYVEFILQKTEDVIITEGLQQLSSSCQGFDFLNNEPELYSINDLKATYL